jgi:hypothetical protein
LVAILVQTGIYLMAFRDTHDERRLRPKWMVMGGLALLLWLSVGIAGRAIAFI